MYTSRNVKKCFKNHSEIRKYIESFRQIYPISLSLIKNNIIKPALTNTKNSIQVRKLLSYGLKIIYKSKKKKEIVI